MAIPFKHIGLIGLGAALICTAPLLAQQMELGKRDASRVSGGTYQVDHYHTMVRWQVDHLGITPYFGIFGDITGTLTLDPKNLAAAKVDITIPVGKVTTANAELTAHLLKPPAKAGGKPDFFGAKPADARFVSTSVVPDSDDPDEAKITGNLTLNGVTRPVTLDAKLHGAGKAPKEMGGQEMVGFEAETTIKRSDFGIDMGIPMVSDEVELDIVAGFVK
jgi:polyisoprenoid-binding protein YceI